MVKAAILPSEVCPARATDPADEPHFAERRCREGCRGCSRWDGEDSRVSGFGILRWGFGGLGFRGLGFKGLGLRVKGSIRLRCCLVRDPLVKRQRLATAKAKLSQS